MRFDIETPGRLALRDGDVVLAEYVYEPDDAAVESPRPYATLRTRGGRDVTAYRPDDHVWHKGLSLALPYVGDTNFWGGPTYVHGEAYALTSPATSLRWLDEYEGIVPGREAQSEYERVERIVRLEAGSDLTAWVYLYLAPLGSARVVESGRWLLRRPA